MRADEEAIATGVGHEIHPIEAHMSASMHDTPPDMLPQAQDYLESCITEVMQELELQALDMSWMAPSHKAVPAKALARIKSICLSLPELFEALQAVGATHTNVPREVLALALKKFRPDLESLDNKEVVALLTSIANGGRSGFDSANRNRKKGGASAAVLPWGGAAE